MNISSQRTEKLTDATWTSYHRDRYDSGSVEGNVIKESVVIGGMAVKRVEMGLVKRQGQRIRGFKADGIVGLAFPSISTTRNTSPSQHSTFVQLLQEQFGGTGDLFSVYLTRESYSPAACLCSLGVILSLACSLLLHTREYLVDKRLFFRYTHDWFGEEPRDRPT